VTIGRRGRPSSLARRLRLIVVTDAGLVEPRSVVEVVREAVAAGAPAVQLRQKGASARELFEAGRALLPVVREADALFFVNDRVDVGLALGADGVHVGPDDVPVAGVRAAVERARGRPERPARRRPFIIGASADDPEIARRLVADGADYIGCGTVYATRTKPDAGSVIGLDGLQRVVDAVDVPVVGIGGIDARRSAEIAEETRATGVAVVGAVMGAEEVGEAVRALLEPWQARSSPY